MHSRNTFKIYLLKSSKQLKMLESVQNRNGLYKQARKGNDKDPLIYFFCTMLKSIQQQSTLLY